MIASPEYRSIDLRIRRGIDHSPQRPELLTILEQLEQLRRDRSDATTRLRQEYEPRQQRLDDDFDQQHAEVVQHLRRRLGLPQTGIVRSHQDNFGSNDILRPRANTADFQMGENYQQEQAEPREPTPANHNSLFMHNAGIHNDFDETLRGTNSDVNLPLIETAAPLNMQPVYDGTFVPMPHGSDQPVVARDDSALRDVAHDADEAINPENDCLCGQPSAEGSLAGYCKTCAELFETDCVE